MKKAVLVIILLLIASTCPAQEDSRPYLRHPALSPDGSTICFSCKGDLWMVSVNGGEAERLTVHSADDFHPQFSPDGSMIVFASDRYKNPDLYVIPITGGEPRRLTHYTGTDIPTGWTPDGDTVIFYSYRDFYYDVYKVPLAGGTPVSITGGFWEAEYNGKITPDGSKLVFNNGAGRSRWWRTHLAGDENTDIWMIDRSADQMDIQRLTSRDGHELWPIYDTDNEIIYFVANRDSLPNIWKLDVQNGTESRVTSFTYDGVQWLNSDPQMKKMVFEQNFYIWYFDPAQGDPRKVNITLASDTKENPVKHLVYRGDEIQEYDISPDNKLAALIIRGEVFLIPTEEPELARKITNTPQREKHICFGADSRTLYYSSDRNGNYDIYKYDLTKRQESRITNDTANESKPLCSPDTSKLVFYRGLDQLVLYDLQQNAETDTVKGMFIDLAIEPHIEYDFSPDSRYLTFTMAGETYETNIYITDFKSEPVNVSHLTDYCYRPRFSDDGKLVYFSRWGRDDHVGTFKIDLSYEPFEFAEDKLDSILVETAKDEEEDKDKDDKKPKIEPTEINFDDIHKRVKVLLNMESSQNYPVVTHDGEKAIFIASIMGKPEVWSVNLEGDIELTQLTHSGKGKSDLKLSSDSKHAYFLEGGSLKKINLSDKKTESLKFTAEMDVVVDLENRQKFHETWWMFDQYYYDPEHHGVDWDAMRAKYSPLIEELETEDEFRTVILEMMGDLKSSHIYIYPKQGGPSGEESSAYYGFYIDQNELDQTGRYKIRLVLNGSPAAKAEPPMRAGQYIKAVNGTRLSDDINFYQLLVGERDRKTVFTLADSPDGTEFTTAVKGTSISPVNDLAYEYWVEQRRSMVDSLSDGRLAYIHIRRMNNEYLQRFKQEIVNQTAGKDGVVLDVRYNGGGNIAVHLLGILIKEPYIYRNFVGYPVISENKMRSKALEKPSILLMNNGSGSNSEIFAEGYRKLGLGKIVGTRTAGGVIGTASYNLIDDTRIRRPSWGCYSTDGENLELIPRYPDITVENLLKDILAGDDPQLKRAVDELMKELD